MMLDASGSMGGKKWTDLISSFKKFVNHLEGNDDLRRNSEMTVITFDNTANIVFQ
jgi:uncharacterized protein YegL